MGIGRQLLAVAAIGLGTVICLWDGFAFAWQPIPTDLPGYRIIAYLAGAGLIVGGAGLVIERATSSAAILLILVFGIFAFPWVLRVVRFPQLSSEPGEGSQRNSR